MSVFAESEINNNKYRPDIEGLRAIAVCSVVAFHIGISGFSGGFIGVDIFFVISGYLISRIIFDEVATKNSFDFKKFYSRRIRRILPSLAIVIIVTGIVSYFVMLPPDQNQFGREVRSVATINSNIYFMERSFDYFDSDLRLMLHTWSLSVEEQFYLVWPLTVLGIFRFNKLTNCHLIVYSVISLIFLSFSYCLWNSFHDEQRAFYLTQSRAWEFAVGAFVAVLNVRKIQNSLVAVIFSGSGIGLLFFSIAFLNENMVFPGYIALLPVVGTALCLLGGSLNDNNFFSRKILAVPIVVFIGRLSYGFYLWHWPILALGRYYGGNRSVVRDFLLGGIVSFILAFISFKYLENPVRLRKYSYFANDRITLRSGGYLLLILWITGNISMFLPEHIPWIGQKSILKIKSDVMPHLADCDVPQEGIPLPSWKRCLIGQTTGPVKIMALGDSHTGHIAPLYDKLAKMYHVAVLMREFDGCPPFADVVPVGTNQVRFWCTNSANAVQQELPMLAKSGLSAVFMDIKWNLYAKGIPKSVGLIAAGNHDTPYAENNFSDFGLMKDVNQQSSLQLMAKSLDRLSEFLQQHDLKLIFVLPEPEMPKSVPECIASYGLDKCNISRQSVMEQGRVYRDILQKTAHSHSNVRIWDPLNEFCNNVTCFATDRNGFPRFADNNHITATMARSMSADFNDIFLWSIK